jgi:60 kDa SS-A/Ro ribonucleoprotein
LLRAVFDRVIDDGKMLRNFVQVLRSGVTGRKSLGTVPKKLAQRWLESRTDEQLFRASVGNAPSMADLIKMVHPKPGVASREALYGYMLDRKHNAEALPAIVKQFEAFKAGQRDVVPDVPFQMLTALELGKTEWKAIAKNAPWQMTRMNLNTFLRHDVFADQAMVKLIAHRLADAQQVKRARVFPYQLLAAFKNAGGDMPNLVRDALQDAMEVATGNVPRIDGKVYVLPDVSGSMSSPVTGHRAGATSSVRCIDVAALVAASILRQNPQAEILPFATAVVDVRLNRRDSVMTNAQKLAAVGGGGTNCSAPLAWLNEKQAKGDVVIYVSDNESWADAQRGRGTEMLRQWSVFKRFNPQARLVCIDLQPNASTQATESGDVLNIGGFSYQVFEVIAAFAEGRLGADHWVGLIARVSV